MAEAVGFLLGHEPRELREVDPNLTVLGQFRGRTREIRRFRPRTFEEIY